MIWGTQGLRSVRGGGEGGVGGGGVEGGGGGVPVQAAKNKQWSKKRGSAHLETLFTIYSNI